MFSVGSVVMVLNGEYVDCVAYIRSVFDDGGYEVEIPFIDGSEFAYIEEQDIKLLIDGGLLD